MVVYSLTDPKEHIIRYIGISHNTAEHRFRMHLKDAKVRRKKGIYISTKEKWLLSLFEEGLQPIINVLASDISEEEAIRMEQEYIAKYKRVSEGGILYNIQEGGFYDANKATPWNRGISGCYDEDFIRNNKLAQPNRKPVFRFDKNGNLIDEWSSIRDMCATTGLDRRTVMRCLKAQDNFRSCQGFMFSHTKTPPVFHNNSYDMIYENSPHAKRIKAILPSGEEYHYLSIKQASEELHVNSSEISSALHGKRASTKHIKFYFE